MPKRGTGDGIVEEYLRVQKVPEHKRTTHDNDIIKRFKYFSYKKCHVKDCNKFASYGYEKDTVRPYCKEHAKEGMVCKTAGRCIVCKNVIASFNLPNKFARYCKSCKSPEMRNTRDKTREMNYIQKENKPQPKRDPELEQIFKNFEKFKEEFGLV